MARFRRVFAILFAAAGITVSAGSLGYAQYGSPDTAKPMPDAVKVSSGGLLTDANGLTLYTFDNDADGKSACNGACAQNWPPLPAAADAKATGAFTIVTRDDGSKQWAYNGKPLYHWKNDKAPGDTTGDGVLGKWHIVKPT